MSIPAGASGAQAEIAFGVYLNGVAVTVANWPASSHVVLLRLPDGTYQNADKANIVYWGDVNGSPSGKYGLQLTDVESADAGQCSVYIESAGGEFDPWYSDETIEPAATAIASAVVAAIMSYSLDTGRTVGGFFRRAYAHMFGKNTGQNVTGNVIAYKSDGTTPEYTVAQDVEAGTRQSAGAE